MRAYLMIGRCVSDSLITHWTRIRCNCFATLSSPARLKDWVFVRCSKATTRSMCLLYTIVGPMVLVVRRGQTCWGTILMDGTSLICSGTLVSLRTRSSVVVLTGMGRPHYTFPVRYIPFVFIHTAFIMAREK